MATTTTNYGFDVPTSSDLVKNGATQIALLGQDLDTFLFRPFSRNGLLNSAFNVWQRGTSIAGATAINYTADRWQGFRAGSTFSRQVTGDTTNLPNIQYCMRVQRNSGTTGTSSIVLSQSLETLDAIPFAGKTVTLSFYARKGANFSHSTSSILSSVFTGTGTDQSYIGGYTGLATAFSNSSVITTTWQRFTFTGSIAATATELAVNFSYDPSGTAGAADYFEVTGVQLEVGNQASPYAPATPTYATELAACQRYFQTYGGSSYGELTGQFYNTTAARFSRALLVSLRSNNPTVTFPTGTFTNFIEEVGVANRTPTAFVSNGLSYSHFTFSATGMTGATTNSMAAWSASATAVTISAEL